MYLRKNVPTSLCDLIAKCKDVIESYACMGYSRLMSHGPHLEDMRPSRMELADPDAVGFLAS
jgi:hypothetical protein